MGKPTPFFPSPDFTVLCRLWAAGLPLRSTVNACWTPMRLLARVASVLAGVPSVCARGAR